MVQDNYQICPRIVTAYAPTITDRCSTRMSVDLGTLADVITDPLTDMSPLVSRSGSIQRLFSEFWYYLGFYSYPVSCKLSSGLSTEKP